jgi:3-methyladenine DNA glycosylase/8-oxoguanine DNA glycosylase
MRVLEVPETYHLGRTLASQRMGLYDPTCAVTDDLARLALRTPKGPTTLHAAQRGARLEVSAWGDGADWLLDRAAPLLGLEDEPPDFRSAPRPLRELARRYSGMHLPRLPRVFHRLAAIVLLQLVTHQDALRSWTSLVRALGEDAPGPEPLRLPPSAERLLSVSTDDLVALGVLPRQARTLRLAARHAAKIERAAEEGVESLEALLEAIPGIGPWSVQYALGNALGHADAVLLGDYNLPSAISWALLRDPRADDARMLELLEPYRGHRFRVIRLVWMSGVFPPRRGPRAPSRRA